jgi:hypothetical protein
MSTAALNEALRRNGYSTSRPSLPRLTVPRGVAQLQRPPWHGCLAHAPDRRRAGIRVPADGARWPDRLGMLRLQHRARLRAPALVSPAGGTGVGPCRH